MLLPPGEVAKLTFLLIQSVNLLAMTCRFKMKNRQKVVSRKVWCGRPHRSTGGRGATSTSRCIGSRCATKSPNQYFIARHPSLNYSNEMRTHSSLSRESNFEIFEEISTNWKSASTQLGCVRHTTGACSSSCQLQYCLMQRNISINWQHSAIKYLVSPLWAYLISIKFKLGSSK